MTQIIKTPNYSAARVRLAEVCAAYGIRTVSDDRVYMYYDSNEQVLIYCDDAIDDDIDELIGIIYAMSATAIYCLNDFISAGVKP